MSDDTPCADFPADLYDRLIAVFMGGSPLRISGRVDASLDAAEALFALVILTPAQRVSINSELRAGIAGDLGYEPRQIVRAVRLLARSLQTLGKVTP